MPLTPPLTFKLPPELVLGLADGSYELFGLVVDNSTNRVIRWLDPIAAKASRTVKINPKIAIAALVVVAVAGGATVAYYRFNRKARLARELAKTDRAIQKSLAGHPSELSRDDLCRIRASIDDFLCATEKQMYQGVTLSLPEDTREMLIGLADALQSFSAKLSELSRSSEPIPEITFSPSAPELLPLLETIRAQIAYQDRNWPNQGGESDFSAVREAT